MTSQAPDPGFLILEKEELEAFVFSGFHNSDGYNNITKTQINAYIPLDRIILL